MRHRPLRKSTVILLSAGALLACDGQMGASRNSFDAGSHDSGTPASPEHDAGTRDAGAVSNPGTDGGVNQARPMLNVDDVHSKQGVDLQFIVKLDRPLDRDVTLTYSTQTVTAAVPTDFQPQPSTPILLPAGKQQIEIRVPTYFSQLIVEPKEVALVLENSPEVVLKKTRAVGTIEPQTRPANRFTTVDVGTVHACAVTSQGAVECWGDSPRLTPIAGLTDAVSLSSYASKVCAVTKTGGVTCWLMGVYERKIQAVPGLSAGATAVAVGEQHACALVNGGIKCWGQNALGQLGTGTLTASEVPVDVKGLTSGYVAVASGATHTCALSSAGAVKCWGGNSYAQTGASATAAGKSTAVNVPGLASGVKAISLGGYRSCALKNDGSVVCWGHNVLASGGLYNIDSANPVSIALLPKSIAISARGNDVQSLGLCAINTQGVLRCVATPSSAVDADTNVQAFSDTRLSTCVLSTAGTLRCAGYQGVRGPATLAPQVPFDVGSNASRVSGACVITNAGAVECLDSDGKWTLVTGLTSGVKDLASHPSHSCAVTSAGAVRCWGTNVDGNLGNGGTTPSPAPVAAVGLTSGVQQVSVGESHSCALTAGGEVKCWGSNRDGQLGQQPEMLSAKVPVTVPGLGNKVKMIFSGGQANCAVMESGVVNCWGYSVDGRVPHPISGVTQVRSIAVSYLKACAVTQSETVICWPHFSGKIESPFQVLGRLAKTIVAGDEHFCAVTQDNQVACWGNNVWGQLGDPSRLFSGAPVQVFGLENVESLGAGPSLSCSISRPAGRLRCFGRLSDAFGNATFSPLVEYL